MAIARFDPDALRKLMDAAPPVTADDLAEAAEKHLGTLPDATLTFGPDARVATDLDVLLWSESVN